ncbi:diacylglycerol/lipid kinase family protein [Olegusella massiliensis]|uniref:diacylglycerol/lipid kinase family protein n=1 Tax=Olegusella massiliensis TaxID=1776381 RepID=UPI0023F7CB31|nr:YegS/Rv2252/BmrU family lipid kinase [Olegusella massiliensis]
MSRQLGRTIVIANPAARSGKGAHAAEFVRRYFEAHSSATDTFQMQLTHAPGHAQYLAAQAIEADTVIALGGDGLINEVVNGLMQIPTTYRPTLAVIAMGSGNDFARTLGSAINDPKSALTEIMMGTTKQLDLGVLDKGTPEEKYYIETLSFGLDAAIAIDTTDRRAANTHQRGAALFATSGLKIMSKAHHGWAFNASYCDATGNKKEISGREIIFAVQQGVSYGGGFQVTPKADPSDGLLDLCYNCSLPIVPNTLRLFGLARLGKHTRSRHLVFDQLTHLDIYFPEEIPPGQIDGEKIPQQKHHSIDVAPAVLKVIAPRNATDSLKLSAL